MNHPPTVNGSNVENGRIVLVNSPQTVFVQFADEDGDDITVEWLIDSLHVTDPSKTILKRDSDTLWSAFLQINAQDVHDGSRVDCFYSDGSSLLQENLEVVIP